MFNNVTEILIGVWSIFGGEELSGANQAVLMEIELSSPVRLAFGELELGEGK